MELCICYALQKNKATQNLEATQEMEMLMEHLFIQDLNQLGYDKNTSKLNTWLMYDNKRVRI